MNFPFLTLIVLFPALAGGLVLTAKPARALAARAAVTVTGLVGLLVLTSAFLFDPSSGFAFKERYEWLPAIGFEYHLAADGISMVFLVLTVIVLSMCFVASGKLAIADTTYYGLMLIFEAGLLGTFTAQNFLHFFLFWEATLIPAFFLIKNYGGSQRSFAAIQFFLYTMVGSIAMLLAFLALYFVTGTFDVTELARLRGTGGVGPLLREKFAWTSLEANNLGLIIFLLAFAGVAVKVPIWPLHAWQPLAYSEAPTPVTMALTGIMSKMGIYALIRFILPVFPVELAALHQPLLILSVITILYGAFAAFAQRDIKRLFAYSSLSHLGYCFLGVFAAAKVATPGLLDDRVAAINGVILQVLSHGLVAAALFAFVSFLETRNGSRNLESFGGLRTVNPRFAGLMGVALFASLGLPGLSGFPAEFLIFKGTFSFAPVAASIAVIGLLLTAIYILNFYGKVFFGPLPAEHQSTLDLTGAEKLIVLPSIAGAFLLGITPQVAIHFFNAPVLKIVQGFGI